MPVGRSAKKKIRQDKVRQKQNLLVKEKVKLAIKKFRLAPKEDLLSGVFSLLDNASKKKIYHANKVARLKSNLAKLLGGKPVSSHLKPKSQKRSPRRKKSSV